MFFFILTPVTYVSNYWGIITLLKPTAYYTYYQVEHSRILHADYIAFTCIVLLSEQTVTFALYIINRLVFITEVKRV